MFVSKVELGAQPPSGSHPCGPVLYTPDALSELISHLRTLCQAQPPT